MPFKLNFRGIEVTANSVSEAAALLRELAEPSGAKIGRPPKPPSPLDMFAPPKDTDIAVAFLRAIAKAGTQGAVAEDLMPLLKVKGPKGIGGRSVRINNMITKAGFKLEDVYDNARTAEGRFWRPGPSISAAINALSQ